MHFFPKYPLGFPRISEAAVGSRPVIRLNAQNQRADAEKAFIRAIDGPSSTLVAKIVSRHDAKIGNGKSPSVENVRRPKKQPRPNVLDVRPFTEGRAVPLWRYHTLATQPGQETQTALRPMPSAVYWAVLFGRDVPFGEQRRHATPDTRPRQARPNVQDVRPVGQGRASAIILCPTPRRGKP